MWVLEKGNSIINFQWTCLQLRMQDGESGKLGLEDREGWITNSFGC